MVAEDGEQGFFRRGGHAEMRAVDMEDKLAHGQAPRRMRTGERVRIRIAQMGKDGQKTAGIRSCFGGFGSITGKPAVDMA
jgi:hypothetical protein